MRRRFGDMCVAVLACRRFDQLPWLPLQCSSHFRDLNWLTSTPIVSNIACFSEFPGPMCLSANTSCFGNSESSVTFDPTIRTWDVVIVLLWWSWVRIKTSLQICVLPRKARHPIRDNRNIINFNRWLDPSWSPTPTFHLNHNNPRPMWHCTKMISVVKTGYIFTCSDHVTLLSQ